MTLRSAARPLCLKAISVNSMTSLWNKFIRFLHYYSPTSWFSANESIVTMAIQTINNEYVNLCILKIDGTFGSFFLNRQVGARRFLTIWFLKSAAHKYTLNLILCLISNVHILPTNSENKPLSKIHFAWFHDCGMSKKS